MAEFDLKKECPAALLVPHPTARSQAVAEKPISAGSTIVFVPALASVLLEGEKGRRCNMCHRAKCAERPLHRCSGCASYWYCDAKCQDMDWRTQHKRICKNYNNFIASPQYQSLPTHQKLDSVLLSHLVARNASSDEAMTCPSMSTFRALMPWSITNINAPPICPGLKVSQELLKTLYSRFGNNNFVIHSHLTTFGHGIFPLASRLFNHSCLPNAAPKYTLSGARSVVMEVVALRDILPMEEITIPYLDPALLQSRHQILDLTYGFRCDCMSCIFLRNMGDIPKISIDPEEIATLGKRLVEFVGIQEHIGPQLPYVSLQSIPAKLYPVLQEEYMSNISEAFSGSSHGGEFTLALQSGKILLALYILVYPQNYPQIGLHLLELAKVRWNAIISSNVVVGGVEERVMKGEVRVFIALSRKILMVFGPEGDLDDSPLSQLTQLEKLLD